MRLFFTQRKRRATIRFGDRSHDLIEYKEEEKKERERAGEKQEWKRSSRLEEQTEVNISSRAVR